MNNQFLIIGGLGVVAVSVLGWWWWQNGQEDPWIKPDTSLVSGNGSPAGSQFRPRSVTLRKAR